jgi:maltose O-acetyltransferase
MSGTSRLRRPVLRAIARRTPTTRCYSLRARLLRLQGFDVARDARVVSSASFLLGRVSIGGGTFVGHNFRAYGGTASRLAIGARCDIGPDVRVLAGSHQIGDHARRAGPGTSSPVEIGDGCWIGGGAVLVGPCSVGPGSIVAAGAIVRGDVPPDSVQFGPRRPDARSLEPRARS